MDNMRRGPTSRPISSVRADRKPPLTAPPDRVSHLTKSSGKRRTSHAPGSESQRHCRPQARREPSRRCLALVPVRRYGLQLSVRRYAMREPAVTARPNTAEGSARTEAVTSILDAAEALLIAEGQRAVTTRRLSEQAGVNHGLVHYYFGSMDEVMMQTFERFTARLIVRQRTMYAADVPFLQKWRMAMSYLDEDLAAGYPKVWMELQALGWNRPEMRERVAAMTGEWRGVLTDAFGKAAAEYHLDPDQFPVEALVSLVMTFNQGLLLERLSGISEGHRELLRWVDDWLVALEAGK